MLVAITSFNGMGHYANDLAFRLKTCIGKPLEKLQGLSSKANCYLMKPFHSHFFARHVGLILTAGLVTVAIVVYKTWQNFKTLNASNRTLQKELTDEKQAKGVVGAERDAALKEVDREYRSNRTLQTGRDAALKEVEREYRLLERADVTIGKQEDQIAELQAKLKDAQRRLETLEADLKSTQDSSEQIVAYFKGKLEEQARDYFQKIGNRTEEMQELYSHFYRILIRIISLKQIQFTRPRL